MRRLRSVALAVVAVVIITTPAAAGNPFRDSTSTEGGYHTYDSDQINIEDVTETGEGVFVAVLDTGLIPTWSDYFPEARVASHLGAGFYQNLTFQQSAEDPCEFVETSRGPLRRTNFLSARGSTHGTHVTSTIIGYNYDTHFDDFEGYPLPPIQVRGIAPNVTIIPVKVLADYTLPPSKGCEDGNVGGQQVFGTDEMVAAGINYVTDLKESGALGNSRVVINMSLGGPELVDVEKAALDRAIAAGVIVVASAGNEGSEGMGFPGAYGPVISVGAAGWTGEWLDADGTAPDNDFRYRMWWLKDTHDNLTPPLQPGSGEVVDGDDVGADTYVAGFSSWELTDQELDVLAPGSWVRGPFPGTPGYGHLPWWSKGLGDAIGGNPGNYYYVGGTSMAAPHVAAVAALMLEANPSLGQGQIETTLESTAVELLGDTRSVWNPFLATPAFEQITWPENAEGYGLIQADAAIAAIH